MRLTFNSTFCLSGSDTYSHGRNIKPNFETFFLRELSRIPLSLAINFQYYSPGLDSLLITPSLLSKLSRLVVSLRLSEREATDDDE